MVGRLTIHAWLLCRRTLRPPEEAAMPDFKEPDDTSDAKGGDAW